MPRTVVGAPLPHRSVQRELASQLTPHGGLLHTTLHCALIAHATVEPAPTVTSQLEARHVTFAWSDVTTVQLAPSLQVASHVAAQPALHEAVVHWRWQPVPVALHPTAELQPHERPSGHAQPFGAHTHSLGAQAGPFAA